MHEIVWGKCRKKYIILGVQTAKIKTAKIAKSAKTAKIRLRENKCIYSTPVLSLVFDKHHNCDNHWKEWTFVIKMSVCIIILGENCGLGCL